MYIRVFAHNPHHIALHERLVRGGGMKGAVSTLHSHYQTMIILADASVFQRLAQERRLPVYAELAQLHLTLLHHIHVQGR